MGELGTALLVVIVVIVAIGFLREFDKVAGRGPKQVSTGIKETGLDRPPVRPTSVATELEALDRLRKAGTLTDQEFEVQKRKLLGG